MSPTKPPQPPNLNPTPVEPIGRTRTMALCNPGGLREVDLDVYPPHPFGEALHDTRVALDLGLREGAALLGLTPERFSALETGRAALTLEEWLTVWQLLVRAWRAKRPTGATL